MSEVTSCIKLKAKTFERIDLLKEDNYHGEAYQLAAEALGLSDLADTFARINREHERACWLTPPLQVERRAAYEKLLAEAKKLLSEEQYNKLYRCF